MADSILTSLAGFQPTDPTARLVTGLMNIVPGAPPLVPYPALASVVASVGGAASDVAGATAQLENEELLDVLWMTDLVDTGDRGYAIFTGVGSALKLFFGKKENRAQALETDNQQRNDAVLKALALSYLVWKAYPGTIPQRATAFAESPAGRQLLIYYAAVEIGLPFADNAALAGGRLFDDLMARHGKDQLARMASLAGGRDLGQVGEALSAVTGTIRSTIEQVRPHLDKIAGALKTHAPGAATATDRAAGVLANVADVMPVYRMMGARVAAEAAVARGRS